ncbi:Gp29 [Salmonella enterica]|uniref:Gp29 n=1 Tax=Salmonella enterica TaxID=28901 RepID=A0A379SD37_SALER|nr:Gp29 [Salmonella enterica]
MVGKHKSGQNEGSIDELMDALEKMVQDAVAVIPDDSSVEIKEAMGKANSSGIFQQMIAMARAEISIALLGQNQTTEADANKASAQAGLEVTNDIRDGDATLVAGAINQALRYAAELNFGDVPVPVWNMWEQESIDDTQAKRDLTLSQTAGFFSEQYYQREYCLQPGDLLPRQGMPQPPETAGAHLPCRWPLPKVPRSGILPHRMRWMWRWNNCCRPASWRGN